MTKKTTAKKSAPKMKATVKKTTSTIKDSTRRKTSAEYKKAQKKAETYAKDPKKLHKLSEEALNKAQTIDKGPFKEAWAYLMAMIRLLRAYYKGEYRDIPWPSLVMIIAAVVYFVAPIDAISDFIPGIGYLDDALVVALALRTVQADLDDFMLWEARQA